MNKIKDILIQNKKILKENGFYTYALDVEVLLLSVLNKNKSWLYLNPDFEVDNSSLEIFNSYIQRRLKNEPIAYIIGKCEFMGLDFKLNEHTLIPRADTEILVEKVLSIIEQENIKKVLDIGTGSGAIAVSIAKYKDVDVLALDINKDALYMAKENARANGVDKVRFLQSNLFENVEEKFDMIVSNPPYIETEEIQKLEPNVKDFEPILALDGGEDGLDFYREIIAKAKLYLNDKGYLAFEIGYNQAKAVSSLMEKEFKEIEILKDLASLDRVVLGRLK